MLVLSRKAGEKLIINNDITLTILEVIGNRVKIGIEAPDQVRILRGELAWWQEVQPAAPATRPGRPAKALASR